MYIYIIVIYSPFVTILRIYLFYFSVSGYFACMCVSSACRAQKRVLDFLKLLQRLPPYKHLCPGQRKELFI